MTNTLFLIPYLSKLLYCFPLARANIRPRPLVPFFQISLKNSELKTTHNTFRGCRVHFFRQPFSKQLYMLVPVCTTPPTPLPPPQKKNLITITLMATNILPENLKGRNILRTLGLHCQWDTYTFFMLVLERWLYLTKPLFYGFMVGEGGAYMQRYHQLGRGGRDKQLLASYELPPTPPLIILYNTND